MFPRSKGSASAVMTSRHIVHRSPNSLHLSSLIPDAETQVDPNNPRTLVQLTNDCSGHLSRSIGYVYFKEHERRQDTGIESLTDKNRERQVGT